MIKRFSCNAKKKQVFDVEAKYYADAEDAFDMRCTFGQEKTAAK